ncbi:MAG: hypothetical protein AB7N76_31355 [Planctomycetota bacterium]
MLLVSWPADRVGRAQRGDIAPPAAFRRQSERPGSGKPAVRAVELRLHLRALLDEALAALHAERAAEGRGYLGARQILRQDPEDRPPGSTRPTHARNPRVSCADRDRRLEELCHLEEYRHQRGATRHAWSQGNHQVVFPPGTYAHPRYHAARVGRAPPRPL